MKGDNNKYSLFIFLAACGALSNLATKPLLFRGFVTLMVPRLLAATMTLLFCFQQTADTNSFTSSSFLHINNSLADTIFFLATKKFFGSIFNSTKGSRKKIRPLRKKDLKKMWLLSLGGGALKKELFWRLP